MPTRIMHSLLFRALFIRVEDISGHEIYVTGAFCIYSGNNPLTKGLILGLLIASYFCALAKLIFLCKVEISAVTTLSNSLIK